MRLRRVDPLAGVNLLDVRPRREVGWETGPDGCVVLVRERPRIRGPRSLGRWISFMMAPPRIRLDDVGSFAWSQLDGRTTVGVIARDVRREFGERVEPAEQRLGHLVHILRRERFVSYPELETDRRSRT